MRTIGRLALRLWAIVIILAGAFGATAAAAQTTTLTYTYDALGRVTSVSDGNGNTTTYAYDAAGNRTQYVVTVSRVTAHNVSVTVHANTTTTIPLNITGGTPTSVAVSTQASHGTATASGTTISYTPTTNFFGSDSFQYTASNSAGTSAPATVSITVLPPPPIANNSSVTVDQNSTNDNIPLNITGGPPASVTVATQASHGTATASGTTITYTPAATYFGPDSFTYTASNAGGTSAPATVSITVKQIPPVSHDSSATVAINAVQVEIALNITGGTPTSVTITTAAGHGSVTANGTVVIYTPSFGYTGPDSFQYTAANGAGTSGVATVSITVLAPPTAGDSSATVAENSTNNPLPLNLSGGAATSVAVIGQGANGTATASGTSITYTPNAGFSGSDTIVWNASNAVGISNDGHVAITVMPPPPIAGNSSLTVSEDSVQDQIPLNLSGGTPASFTIVTKPTNGSASVNNANPPSTAITYTPSPGFFGSDSFQYTATNAAGTSAPATVSITVSGLPVAGDSSATVAENSTNDPITLNLSGGPPTSVAVIAQPTNGVATASGTTITYTPNAGFSGSDSFVWNATNSVGTSNNPGTVSINVVPPPPIAGNSSLTVSANSVQDQVPLNLSGGTPASFTIVTQPTNGSASVNEANPPQFAITYTPNPNYTGSDSFQYTATNAGGTSQPAKVSVTVTP
jgi:YD repeat-containing protein